MKKVSNYAYFFAFGILLTVLIRIAIFDSSVTNMDTLNKALCVTGLVILILLACDEINVFMRKLRQ